MFIIFLCVLDNFLTTMEPLTSSGPSGNNISMKKKSLPWLSQIPLNL